MNLKIREFKVTLENYINNTDLPPEVKRIVLKEIYNDISAMAERAVAAEIEERDKYVAKTSKNNAKPSGTEG